MQEFIAFNEQRAEIYWWMSSLLSRELTEDDITEYQAMRCSHSYLASV